MPRTNIYKYTPILTKDERLIQLLDKITVNEMKNILKENKLSTKGNRNDLLIRLQENEIIPLYPYPKEYNPSKRVSIYDDAVTKGAKSDYLSGPQKIIEEIKEKEQGKKYKQPIPYWMFDNPPQYLRDTLNNPKKYKEKKVEMKINKVQEKSIPIDVIDEELKYLNEDDLLLPTALSENISFEKMTVFQLKEYMKQNKIKPLSGKKADLIARIRQFQNFGIGNKYIYENDIKTSPVYIQKEMPISKQTVADLKQILKQNKLKVSGKKSELIQRLVDAGLYEQPSSMPVKSKKSSKGVKAYEKMTITELKPILKKYKLSVSGKKADLVSRLYDYDRQRELNEMYSEEIRSQIIRATDKANLARDLHRQFKENEFMGQEDIPNTESMAVADAYFPMQENSQLAELFEGDQLTVQPYYRGQYIGNKYSPDEVAQQIARDRLLDVENSEHYDALLEPVTMGMLTNLLPIDVVIETLSTTPDNRVIFQSHYSTDRYDTEELDDEVRATRVYNVDGWMFRFIDINGNWAIVYQRYLNADKLMEKVTDSVKQKVEDFLKNLPKDIKQVIIEYPQLRYCRVALGSKRWVVNDGGNYKYSGAFDDVLGPNRDLCGLRFNMVVKPSSRLPEPTRTVIYTVTEDGEFVEI